MPLYIPWLTETIKKRGVRYLLHHYLGQFFEEKLTLEQLSIDIYEGKGSIKNLALDVDGLNDELDFIPFTFLDGCLIGQISVEVPWSSLVTDACRVELDGAKFFCRLKTTADAAKHHCTESTLLSRSLMTSSMQMAEEIVTTEDDDDIDSIHQQQILSNSKDAAVAKKKKDANQMFEGLEMFAQLIDSVLRRTKLTARNTLFQIQPHNEKESTDYEENEPDECSSDTPTRGELNQVSSRSSNDEFSEPTAKSDTDEDNDSEGQPTSRRDKNPAKSTVEFFIKFFRCEEMIDQTRAEGNLSSSPSGKSEDDDSDGASKSLSAIPETITKLLTLEDVEMRIDGVPVSNLIGKHTITIKFNGQKSEISIFSGSPLLAVISHKQLETFFNVFDSSKNQDLDGSFSAEKNQKLMSPEDYAKIENQLLESASLRNILPSDLRVGGVSSAGGGGCGGGGGFGIGGNSILTNKGPYYANTTTSQLGFAGRRWAPDMNSGARSGVGSGRGRTYSESHANTRDSGEYGYHSPLSSDHSKIPSENMEPTLEHIEAFSCELKLPGIWLCILRAGEALPPLIKPYADSINSFLTINKYIDEHIKVPHIRCLALKVALDITAAGTNVFLGDLDVSEHLEDSSRMSPILNLLNNDQTNAPMNAARYKASMSNANKDVTIDVLTKTRVMFDPTIIDRIVYDYKLVKLDSKHSQAAKKQNHASNQQATLKRSHSADFRLTLRGDQFKLELLCPIPDLTPDAHKRRTQLRPQSFLFDFKDTTLTWQSDKLKINARELLAYVKTQPMQSDSEAVKFIEAASKGSEKITLVLEPSPSNLDNAFNQDIEQALNESSMYDSIYVSQATESRLPSEPFQTKRKVVRASFQGQQTSNKPNSARLSECDHEKILTPGDRQHLIDYLNQTVMATKLSLQLRLPVCEVEFEDKEQLDLIYNRFGNDFVFWQPKAFTKAAQGARSNADFEDHDPRFKRPRKIDSDGDELDEGALDEENDDDDDDEAHDQNDRSSTIGNQQGSYHSMVHQVEASQSERYDNEVTCKIEVDELFVRFNHQSCAAALKQEIAAENFLLGVIIDVNKQPNTLLSLVADNLELSTDLETVLEGNFLGDKNSIFALTAEIKRPTKLLKDIKLAIQLKNGLFNDFRTETYTRFWQSINVTDELILGYVAPQIVTELHIDILNTSLLLVREDARPALLAIDELYMTSMVMEQTSQVMIRLIADEVSLYMKRDRQGLEVMKNYICLIDSGLIDLDVKFGQDNRLEFGVINNVITVRVCQDSLSALCKLFNVLIRNSTGQQQQQQQNHKDASKTTNAATAVERQLKDQLARENSNRTGNVGSSTQTNTANKLAAAAAANLEVNDKSRRGAKAAPVLDGGKQARRKREMNLLADAMNDYSLTGPGGVVSVAAGATRPLAKAESPRLKRAASDDNNEGDGEEDDAGGAKGYVEDKRASGSDGASAASERACSSVGDDSGASASASNNDDDDDEEEDEDEADDGQEDDDGEENNEYDSDSDAPPVFQRAASTSSRSSSSNGGRGGHEARAGRKRDPDACLLDESNPTLGDMFSQPLLPSSNEANRAAAGADLDGARASGGGDGDDYDEDDSMMGSQRQQQRAMDESGFFVIGDDDIGAGIIDKREHEPLVRKLIDGPINIIENHFKMTKPRTIPEMLAHSLERYVLEEMTLIVNLFGGHDFDDEDVAPPSKTAGADGGATPSPAEHGADQAREATNELLDTMSGGGGGSQQSLMRSRAGSLASTTTTAASTRRPSALSNSLRRAGGRAGGRRRHLSESCDPSESSAQATTTQRVRFGEGALNLWESLDLMSSPDFLGARARPSQPALNSELKQAGGTWRENDVCIQLTLNKVKLLYEVADATQRKHSANTESLGAAAAGAGRRRAPSGGGEPNLTPPISWRFMLFIQDIEVKDRIAASDINKMLYEYCTESMPKRSTQMLAIKNVATINPSDGCEECDLRVSLKPLRLNIDQDTLLFLIEFCTAFCKALARQQQQLQAQSSSAAAAAAAAAQPAPPSTASGAAGGRSSRNSAPAGAALPVNPAKQVDGGLSGNAAFHGRASGQQQRQQLGEAARLDAQNNRAARRGSRESQSCGAPAPSGSLSAASHGARGSPQSAAGLSGAGACESHRNGRDVNNSDITITTTTTTIITTGGGRHNDATAAAVAFENADVDEQRQADGDEDEDGEEEENYWESSEDMEEGDERCQDKASQDRGDDEEDGNGGSSSSGDASACRQKRAQRPLPTHCHTDDLASAANRQPIYLKSFTFSPDVPIRIDYHAKHLDFEQGALAGILMGLAHLDHSELILRRVQAKHGMRGLDRVLLFAINAWLSDIKRNQLPSILGGVGPMHSVIQLFQGMRDLVWMPIDHYRKDGRLVRGLQRGASSFSSSTAMAAINLVNRFISIVQCTAQIAHDIVTPPTLLAGGSSVGAHSTRRLKVSPGDGGGGTQLSSSSAAGLAGGHHHAAGGSASSRRTRRRHQARLSLGRADGLTSAHSIGLASGAGGLPGLNQPRNFCEGVAVGFSILKEGFNDTARNVTVGMQAEDMRSAVGELVRQIPSTLLNPIISATEGAQSVLVGIRNQIAPDARREDQEKWKGRVRGK